MASDGGAFMKRSNFSNDDMYAIYVRNNLKAGHTVICCRTYEEVRVGDCGRVTRIDVEDNLQELSVQVDWQHKGDKYWVKYIHVEIQGMLDSKAITMSDWVKVKSSVETPKFQWGSVNRRSIGIITAVSPTGEATVDWPQQMHWKGILSELEAVVKTHPGIMCCGCQMLPLSGYRYKCTKCSEFDYCHECYTKKNAHMMTKHEFMRIICPGGRPVPAGAPDEVIVVGDTVRVNPTVTEPKYKWGNVSRDSIGKVKSISPNGNDVTVDYPVQKNWSGILTDLVKVSADAVAEVKPAETIAKNQAQQSSGQTQQESPPDSDEEDSGQTVGGDLLWWLMAKALIEGAEEGASSRPSSAATQQSLPTRPPSRPYTSRRAQAPGQIFPQSNNEVGGGLQECQYQSVCKRFKKCLELAETYFDASYDTCFCPECHSRRGDKDYYNRGNPPTQYGVPVGWFKFGLRTPAKAESLNVFKTWQVAFHGTRYGVLKSILDTGDLLMPGDLTPDGDQLRPPGNHWDDANPNMKPPPGHDVSKLYLSPSIKYAGCNVYAFPVKFKDSITSMTYLARVCLQVRIKPGSYGVGGQTIGAKTQLDAKIANSQLEWSTKRRGCIVLTGLLVQIEGFGSGGLRETFTQQE